MTYETLTVEVDDDGVALLTLSRPEALNAFNIQMSQDLLDFWTTRATQDDIRAVVVTGAGRAFCAGMDLSREGNVFGLDETSIPADEVTPEGLLAHLEEEPWLTGVRDVGGRISMAVHALPKPVIAAINGPAVGIGATMTLPMDLRLASTSARIGFVFGRLGIVPEATSSYFLPRIVGIQQALEWVYSADIFDAEAALSGRLVRSLHQPEELVPAALELARSFVAGRSAVALGLARQMLWRNTESPLQAHLADSVAMWHTSVGPDGKDGVAAFLEKRPAVFTSRPSEVPRVFPA